MENSDEETELPKYTIVTDAGKSHSSREYTGFGAATYRYDEDKIEKFEGHYVNGVREGKGAYWYWNGDSYEGDFQQNKKSGIGLATYKEQPPEDREDEPVNPSLDRYAKYLGHFREGKRDECGAMRYPNGDVYVGEWSNGLKSGFGRYKFAADKSQLIGTWQHGRLKHGRWQLPSGIYYTGMFKRNKPCGKGVWVFPNGNQVIGEYIQKVREPEDLEVPKEDEKEEEEALPPEELLQIESVEFVCKSCTSVRE
ncbi:morn repeat-containing protein [Cystoisospora suis]|uniref:Morn repeat-containing protein n=1 Tax=Cystoisospora suis TaxID=483139 RepID=A0A2C6KDD0_9APIC|nr:morn repeat-containing protein [Cystoisospora suis]